MNRNQAEDANVKEGPEDTKIMRVTSGSMGCLTLIARILPVIFNKKFFLSC